MGLASSRFAFFFTGTLIFGAVLGCSILATRPVQEMSDTAAALKAAREVQADLQSPELFRQATEWFGKAKREYKFKNFKLAQEYAEKARTYAEQAEFEAIRGGAARDVINESPSSETHPKSSSSPYPYPTPEGISAESYEMEMQKKEEASRNSVAPSGTKSPSPPPSPL